MASINRQSILNLSVVISLLLNFVLFCVRVYSGSAYLRGPAPEYLKDQYQYTYTGDDYPEHLPLPSAPLTQIRVFNLSPSNFPISGPEADAQWSSIYPPGYGFVRLSSSLPPTEDRNGATDNRLLCTALYHQLHCIQKMAMFLNDPVAYRKILGVEHQQHCLNYLRQTTLCRSDLTLERFDELESPNFSIASLRATLEPREDGYADFSRSIDLSVASGRQIVRVCSDAQILYNTAGRNYIEWKSGWNISSPFEGAHGQYGHNGKTFRL